MKNTARSVCLSFSINLGLLDRIDTLRDETGSNMSETLRQLLCEALDHRQIAAQPTSRAA
jgi:hypothetical protein